MDDIETVVRSYAEYLASKSKKLRDRFATTTYSNFEAAAAEAITFGVLQQCRVNPVVADMVNAGGPDFLCVGGSPDQFMVEATSFTPDKFTRDTGLPNEAPEEMRGQAYSLLTAEIDEKVTDKQSQIQKAGMPAVLAIASTHREAGHIFGPIAAFNALMSQPMWTGTGERMTTNFAFSVFLQLDHYTHTVITKNSALSAILLIAIGPHASHVCGALNPAPMHKLKCAHLYQIPFAFLKDWPIENSSPRPDWTLGSTGKHIVPHSSIRL